MEVFTVGLHCEFHAETCLRTEFNSKLHAISVAGSFAVERNFDTHESAHTARHTKTHSQKMFQFTTDGNERLNGSLLDVNFDVLCARNIVGVG